MAFGMNFCQVKHTAPCDPVSQSASLAGYAGCNEISCSLFAPKDEKWRTSSVAAYCRATRRSRVALNFWRAVDPANEIDQSTLSEPRIVSAGVRFPDAGLNA